MSNIAVCVELLIHVTGGQVHGYFEDDPKRVKELLTRGRDGNLFLQAALVFAGLNAVVAYRTPSVWRIDFLSDPESEWLGESNLHGVRAREVSEVEFQQAIDTGEHRQRSSGKLYDARRTFTGLMDIGFVGGERMFVEISGREAAEFEQRQMLQRLFELPVLRCRLSGGGIALLNPAAFTDCTFRLDIPAAPLTAWHAERICS